MKRVLVTGSGGFIGKNVVYNLIHKKDYKVFQYKRNSSHDDLIDILKRVDFIIHLAGVNRPDDDSEFIETNLNFTQYLCDLILKLNLKIPIIFTSSVHVEKSNPYGVSKQLAEESLVQYSKKSGAPIFIFRLPHVVGKWCKPNYNSVVATFCYNISHNIPIQIHDPNFLIEIVHIDDLIKTFIDIIFNKDNYSQYCTVPISYPVTVGALADILKSFKEDRKNFYIDQVGLGLLRVLYSTYISYYDPSMFSYALEEHSDNRGVFSEIIKTKSSGQFSYFTVNIGETRGGHFHHTKTEKFLVVSGAARYQFSNIVTKEHYTICTDGNSPTVVESIPGWVHDITNIGDEKLIVFLWSNEVFDVDNPDTYVLNNEKN